jgi:predicted MPP superfamily phosphohydrolase
VLTGDFRNTTHADHGPSVAETLALLEALQQTGLCRARQSRLHRDRAAAGARRPALLLNEVVVIEFGGAELHLAGVDDPHFYRTHDLAGVRDQIPDDGFSVLLCHSPETYREAAGHGFDVMLSGHTHGGQICLPGGHSWCKVCDAPEACRPAPGATTN